MTPSDPASQAAPEPAPRGPGRVRARLARGWRRLCARDGRRPRLMLLAAFATIVAMYCTNQDMGKQPDAPRGDGVYRPVLARGDGHMMYLMARSTALDGDWWFDNDLARFGDPWRQRTTRTGRKAIAHPIGPALVWTPLIWIAQAGAVIANLAGAGIQLHGYTLWHQRFVFLSSALFGCGAVLLGAWLARRLLGGRWAATYGAIAVLLGTSLTYYATYMPSYAHAMDAMACAAFLFTWAITVGRSDRRRWLVLGVLLGLATLVRVQELAMGVVVALEVVVETVRRRGRWREVASWWLGGAATLAVTLIVFAPQLLEWHLVFGKLTELPQGARYTRLEAPMIGELLFAPRNGWFSTTPVAYAAVLGLVVLPRRARLVAAGLVAAVAIQVYLNSTILDWWGSAAFGQRRLCSVSLPLVVGLASLLWRCGRLARRLPVTARHAIAIAILGPLVAWNLMRVGQLRGGIAAPDALSPTCCDRVPGPLRGALAALYRHAGNPFELPASAWFAWRHDVPIDRWDRTVGNYPLIPALDSLLDDQVEQLWAQRGAWRLGSAGIEPYLVRGWSRSVRPAQSDRALRWTTEASATALVPNLMPYGQRLTLWLAPAGAHHAKVRWNGAVVAEAELAGWTAVTFDLPDIALHTNELEIEAVPAVFAPPAGPAPEGPVGVAVGDLELAFLHP
ncbi:MAG TPA: glycosyltransferase family 39 protein [Kofleriaceae bacterium]|nr:glycosyltransferase family 39 protein [Kofleriaceae bacterium]